MNKIFSTIKNGLQLLPLFLVILSTNLNAQTITGLSIPGATSSGSGTTWNVDFITSSSTTSGYKAIDVDMNGTKGSYLVFDDTSSSSDWEIVQGQPTGGSWFGFCKTMLVNDNACTGNCTMRFYIRNKGTVNGTYKNNITIAIGNSGSSCSYNSSGSYNLGVTMEKVTSSGIYTWIGTHGGGDSTWAQSDNWSPTRTTPSTSDILVVDLGTNSNPVKSTIDIGGVTESISQFRIYNHNTVVFRSTTGNGSITVGNGSAGDDFLVDSFGSMLTSGTKIFELIIPAGNTFQCYGKFGMNYGSVLIDGAGKHTFSNDLNLTHGVLYFRANPRNTVYFNGTNQFINGTASYLSIDSMVDVQVGRAGATTTLTLNRTMELFSTLKLLENTTVKSNTPSGSFSSWVPNLQFRSPLKVGAKSRGQVDVLPSTSSITGGCLFEIAATNIRSYKMFGIPLKNGVNLSQFSDNIDLTGTSSGSNKDSFSTGCTWCLSSVFNWDESSQSWAAYSSGNTANTVPHGKGLMVFVRGPKSYQLGNPYTDGEYVTIDFKGELFSGNKTVNLDYNSSGASSSLRGLNLVSNPYPCAIDFNKITKPSGFKQKFQVYDGRAKTYNVWDSTVSGSLTRTGSNKFVNLSQNRSRLIEAGGSFFAIASNSGESLSFTESCKVASVASLTDQFKATEHNLKCNELRIGIHYKNDSIPENDNSIIQMDMNYEGITNSNDNFDAPKIYAGFLGIGAISEDNVWLSIDRRPAYVEKSFSIPLRVRTPDNNIFKITMDACENNGMRYNVLLVDKMLSKVVPFKNGMEYEFVKSQIDNYTEDRFELMFTGNQELQTSTKNVTKSGIVVYPNPSLNGEFNVVSSEVDGIKSAELYSIDGKLVKILSFNQSLGLNKFKLDSKGTYVLKMIGTKTVNSEIIFFN